MSEWKDFYWANRDVFRLVMAVGVILLVQSLFIVWTLRRMAELAHVRERLSRLADGLALLTDTTEAGMEAIARELQQLSRRPTSARSTSRAAVGKRVVAAARKGAEVATIASEERLSESEVRLHLTLAEQRQADSSVALR